MLQIRKTCVLSSCPVDELVWAFTFLMSDKQDLDNMCKKCILPAEGGRGRASETGGVATARSAAEGSLWTERVGLSAGASSSAMSNTLSLSLPVGLLYALSVPVSNNHLQCCFSSL